LTAAGKVFLQRAQRIELEMLQANEELKSLSDAGIDVLRVAAGPLFHQQYLAPVFSDLLLEFPSLRLDLAVGTNELNLPRLVKGELDVVLGVVQSMTPEGALKDIRMTLLQHGIILSPKHELGSSTIVIPEQMRNLKWVLYGDDEDTETWLNTYFRENNLGMPLVSVHTASFATGMELVRDSNFVMMAPVQLKKMIETAGLRIVKAQPSITNLTSGAYVRPSSMGFPAVKRFLELMAAAF